MCLGGNRGWVPLRLYRRMCILCILFIVVSLYIFFTGLKYSDQVSFAFTMYRFFSVLWALKMSRFIFSFALAFLVLYVFLCLAGVFAIFVHAFHVCPFSFFPLGLRDIFQDVLLACFCIFRGFSQVKQNNDDDDYNNSSSLSTQRFCTKNSQENANAINWSAPTTAQRW